MGGPLDDDELQCRHDRLEPGCPREPTIGAADDRQGRNRHGRELRLGYLKRLRAPHHGGQGEEVLTREQLERARSASSVGRGSLGGT